MTQTLITGHGLEKAYGDKEVLRGVSVTINVGDRVGLVGANGSGKTTLARILGGEEQADGGEVRRGRDVEMRVLAQEPVLDDSASALDVVLGGLEAYSAALSRYEQIGLELEGRESAELLAEQARLAETIESLGGWDLRHKASSVLGHLGVPDALRAVGQMSGGERRRVALARILVAEPDLAILDEPTNHLDIPTIEWLESFLIERYPGAVLLITHDRYLLDRVAKRTIEVEDGQLHIYAGGWQAYLEARAERAEHAARTEANRQNFLRRELDWLRRQPKARTTKQKARVARAEDAIASGPKREKGSASIKTIEARSGKTILEARDLRVELGGKVLVDGLDLTLTAGQRIGVVGRNGAGKTSLLRVLLGQLAPTAGHAKLGANTKVAYLDQARAGLDGSASVFDNVAQGSSHVVVGDQTIEVRSYLYRFLFDNVGQKQRVDTLSGGERARVAIARVLREASNLVVLDEPTNDLDATTLSALEEALLSFGGTSIVVTHDRWFLDRVATHLICFEPNGTVTFRAGNYADYLAAGKLEPAKARGETKAVAKPKAKPKPVKLTYAEEIELGTLMEKIEAAEAAADELEARTTSPEFASLDYKEQAATLEELQKARGAADALVERWSELEAKSGG